MNRFKLCGSTDSSCCWGFDRCGSIRNGEQDGHDGGKVLGLYPASNPKKDSRSDPQAHYRRQEHITLKHPAEGSVPWFEDISDQEFSGTQLGCANHRLLMSQRN